MNISDTSRTRRVPHKAFSMGKNLISLRFELNDQPIHNNDHVCRFFVYRHIYSL